VALEGGAFLYPRWKEHGGNGNRCSGETAPRFLVRSTSDVVKRFTLGTLKKTWRASHRILLFFCFIHLFSIPLFAQQGGFTFSGLAFGDYYWVATNHNNAIEDQNGVWFRRIYFTVDKNLGDSFDVRFRLEMNSPGDFSTSNKLEPFVKDIYIRWRQPELNILLGLSPTPAWEFIEDFWGYRHLEKTPLDLYAMASARDLGIAIRGGGEKLKYALNFGNGAGDRAEINQGKGAFGAVRYQWSENFVTEFYADFNAMPNDLDRYTVQGFIGYRRKSGRVGVQYAHQESDGPDGNSNLDLFSVFGIYEINNELKVIGRFDRLFDPNPAGPDIPYIPFSPDANANLYIAAVEFVIHKYITISPNVEIVTYDHSITETDPETDVIPRLTFFFRY
jgi:hypothetical protein